MVSSEDVVFGITVAADNTLIAKNDQSAKSLIAISMLVKIANDQTISAYLQSVQRQYVQLASSKTIGSAGRENCSLQTLLVVQPREDASRDRVAAEMKGSSQRGWLST